MCGSGRGVGGVACGLRRESAAQRTLQPHRGQKLLRLQPGHALACDEQLLLHAEHVQIAADAGAVTLLGQLEGGRGGLHGIVLRLRALLQRTHGGDLVGHFAQRSDHFLVVVGHGQVVLRIAAGQVGAQLAAVEDRQAERRRNQTEHRAAFQQLAHIGLITPPNAVRLRLG